MTEENQHRDLRDAFGQFATGITVVTARSNEGVPIGLTANSFASVSLSPPLVSWCVDKQSNRFADFSQAEYFCISVLSAEQKHLSDLFAARSWDDSVFNDVKWTSGLNNVPQIPQVSARFQCKLKHSYEGGDHLILVGDVLEFEFSPTEPLVFHAGEYRHLG